MEKPIEGILPEAMTRLESYDWPGNVRELENTMERAVALETGREISLRVLPDRIAGYAGAMLSGSAGGPLAEFPAGGIDFERQIAEAERRYLQAALAKAEGVRTRASELLNISYRSFRHYAKKHNL
jgi:two-component system response regulator PilR (NtrC family)